MANCNKVLQIYMAMSTIRCVHNLNIPYTVSLAVLSCREGTFVSCCLVFVPSDSVFDLLRTRGGLGGLIDESIVADRM